MSAADELLGLLPFPSHGIVIHRSWPLSSALHVWVKRESCCVLYPQWEQEACKKIKTITQHGKRHVNFFSHFHCSRIRKLPDFLRSPYSNKEASGWNANILPSFFPPHSRLIKNSPIFAYSVLKLLLKRINIQIHIWSAITQCPSAIASQYNPVVHQSFFPHQYRESWDGFTIHFSYCLAVSQEILYKTVYFLSPYNLSSQELRGVSFHLGQEW